MLFIYVVKKALLGRDLHEIARGYVEVYAQPPSKHRDVVLRFLGGKIINAANRDRVLPGVLEKKVEEVISIGSISNERDEITGLAHVLMTIFPIALKFNYRLARHVAIQARQRAGFDSALFDAAQQAVKEAERTQRQAGASQRFLGKPGQLAKGLARSAAWVRANPDSMKL